MWNAPGGEVNAEAQRETEREGEWERNNGVQDHLSHSRGQSAVTMDMLEMTLIAWSQKSNEPHREWVLHDMLLISWSGSRIAEGSDQWLMTWFGSMPHSDLIFYLGHPAHKQLGRNRFSALTGLVTISNNFRKILKGWDRKTCLWAFLWYIKA